VQKGGLSEDIVQEDLNRSKKEDVFPTGVSAPKEQREKKEEKGTGTYST